MILGARLVSAWGGAKLALAAEEALVKIEGVLPAAERNTVSRTNLFALGFDLPQATRHVLDELDLAIRGRRRLDAVYEALDGTRTERVLRPLGLYFWGKVWTLAAWCELRDDFRTFRADRLSVLGELEVGFREEPGRTLKDFLRRWAECPPVAGDEP